nr:unnamed protein product [Digitaria exilis]
MGASAVLREVGRRLTAAAAVSAEDPEPSGSRRAPAVAAGPEFSHIFHIDCSKWESRRAMQRTIAEKLELPTPVMDMLDAQDEEDDYSGMGKGSRAEIPHVSEAIYQHIQKLVMNRRFLVIFHNGSSEEIDLNTFGFHLSGYSRNKVLWSFQGRFRLYPRTKVDRALMSTRTTTDVVLSASIEDRWRLPAILSSDAEEVADGSNIIDSFCGLWEEASHHRQAQYCFEYIMKLCRMGSHLVDYELTTHGSNYWKFKTGGR